MAMLNIRLWLLVLLYSTALAIPAAQPIEAALVKRARGDASDPIDAWFSTEGWESMAEQDCYAMLCLGKGRVFQKVSSAEGDRNRGGSGADTTPFKDDHTTKRNTERISDETISAEEFPWASTAEGGKSPGGSTQSYVFPATRAEQQAQGKAISFGYSGKGSDVNNGQHFRINFVGELGEYCQAAMRGDHSICRRDNVQSVLFGVTVILANFVFQYMRDGGVPYQFRRVGKPGKRSDILGEYPVAKISPSS
ncbi:hypothetical protein EJ08DRAFT_730169 [Tothia fuscella]|uniref:Deoxyribonuclease NucA/NucB domain-containing protein n=1 Tax=Tothia fuscella TaxID=1048955 RepID=A0A9P4P1P3_9PEZI|nr:hypothetical protein EJ08DRAFT_730169 [Tothia fuscella]